MFYEANIHNCTENSAIFHEICTEVGAIMNENCTGNSAAPHSLITAFVLIVKLFNNLSGILPDSDDLETLHASFGFGSKAASAVAFKTGARGRQQPGTDLSDSAVGGCQLGKIAAKLPRFI